MIKALFLILSISQPYYYCHPERCHLLVLAFPLKIRNLRPKPSRPLRQVLWNRRIFGFT